MKDKQKLLEEKNRKLPPTTEEYQAIIKKLETELKEERQKRQIIESNLVQFRIRSLRRQQQFFKILDKYNVNKINTIKQNSEIEDMYKKILFNFDAANEQTHKFLENKYKLNHEFMERRVREILKFMENEISLTKKLQSNQIKEIKDQVSQVLALSKEINEQNEEHHERIKKLQFKNQILREEKKLMVQEIVRKKKTISNLQNQLNERIEINQFFHKNTSKNKLTRNSTPKQEFFHPISETPRKNLLSSRQKPLRRKFDIRKNKPYSTMLMRQKQPESMHEKAIESLQKSLKRQKSKNIELGNIITNLQAKEQDINDALIDFLQKKKDKNIDSLKDDKNLIKTMKILKRRLSMVENPVLLCGWQGEIDQLLAGQEN